MIVFAKKLIASVVFMSFIFVALGQRTTYAEWRCVGGLLNDPNYANVIKVGQSPRCTPDGCSPISVSGGRVSPGRSAPAGAAVTPPAPVVPADLTTVPAVPENQAPPPAPPPLDVKTLAEVVAGKVAESIPSPAPGPTAAELIAVSEQKMRDEFSAISRSVDDLGRTVETLRDGATAATEDIKTKAGEIIVALQQEAANVIRQTESATQNEPPETAPMQSFRDWIITGLAGTVMAMLAWAAGKTGLSWLFNRVEKRIGERLTQFVNNRIDERKTETPTE